MSEGLGVGFLTLRDEATALTALPCGKLSVLWNELLLPVA